MNEYRKPCTLRVIKNTINIRIKKIAHIAKRNFEKDLTNAS